MKIEPIPEWKHAWEFASVRLAAVAGAIELLSPGQISALLEWVGIGAERAPLVLALAFLLSRVFRKAEP
jgi:hypothetical protein